MRASLRRSLSARRSRCCPRPARASPCPRSRSAMSLPRARAARPSRSRLARLDLRSHHRPRHRAGHRGPRRVGVVPHLRGRVAPRAARGLRALRHRRAVARHRRGMVLAEHAPVGRPRVSLRPLDPVGVALGVGPRHAVRARVGRLARGQRLGRLGAAVPARRAVGGVVRVLPRRRARSNPQVSRVVVQGAAASSIYPRTQPVAPARGVPLGAVRLRAARRRRAPAQVAPLISLVGADTALSVARAEPRRH